MNEKFKNFAESFFNNDEELSLLQIVGHSYDLETENMWDYMEHFLGRIAADDNVISLTNAELVRYLKAMRSADITDHSITNNSDITLWFEVDGRIISVEPYTNFNP